MTIPSSEPVLRARLKGLTGALAILIVLLGYFEGDRLVAYPDIGGVWSICRGITAGVHAGQVATEEQCHAMNAAEALASLRVVDGALNGDHPAARRAALADFEYNVGRKRFLTSTALRKINAGDIKGGCAQLLRWIYVKGKVVAWQVRRRAFEHELCVRP